MKKKITQKDVAIEAGVDRTTVSKILSGYQCDQFSDKIINRVRETVARLGYKVKFSKLSFDIVFVFSLPEGDRIIPFKSHMILEAIRGISEILRDTPNRLQLLNTKEFSANDLSRGDAYLLWEDYDGVSELLEEQEIPHITLNRISDDYDGACVIHDDYLDYSATAKMLLDAGHCKIAFLFKKPKSVANQKLFDDGKEAIRTELSKSDLEFSEADCFCGRDGHWRDIVKILHQKGYTAAVVQHDLVGEAVVNAALQENVRIPEDLSLVSNGFPYSFGLNGIDFSKAVPSWYKIAKKGTQVMLNSLRSQDNGNLNNVHEIIPPNIHHGETVAVIDPESR